MESHRIPFREIPHTSSLFSTFFDDFSRLAAYYAHPPTAAGVDAAARQIRYEASLRQAVAGILLEQNLRFAPAGRLDAAASRNLDAFAGGAAAILTGQQVGLFSGPAFSFYKALSAVRCAEEVSQRGTDAVPIFWLATEDHDLAEVNHAFWNTRKGLARYELPLREAETGRGAGTVPLDGAIADLVNSAGATLEGPFAGDVLSALRESYAAGETYSTAFAKLLWRLLAGRGILFVDPSDPRLHQLTSGIYQKAIRESDELRAGLLERSRELEREGFHAQVKVTHETTLLFRSMSGLRVPLRAREGSFLAGDAEISRPQLASEAERHPELFTPNALLRPVVQDALFPTAAYIGGPAEIAYFAQAQVVYRKLLGRMPAILPRASFTIVEPAVARFLGQYDLGVHDIFAGRQQVRAKMEQRSLPSDLAGEFEAGEEKLRSLLRGYQEPLARLDSTLGDALRSTEEKILHQFSQLKGKVGRALNFRSGVLDRHERILLDALYPNGGLQERTLCVLPLLAEHGPQLLDTLSGLASPTESSDGQPGGRTHCAVFL